MRRLFSAALRSPAGSDSPQCLKVAVEAVGRLGAVRGRVFDGLRGRERVLWISKRADVGACGPLRSGSSPDMGSAHSLTHLAFVVHGVNVPNTRGSAQNGWREGTTSVGSGAFGARAGSQLRVGIGCVGRVSVSFLELFLRDLCGNNALMGESAEAGAFLAAESVNRRMPV